MNRAFIITAIIVLGFAVAGCDLNQDIEDDSAPLIRLVSPNGGENLAVGTTFDIRWTASEATEVCVALSTDGGVNFDHVVSENCPDNCIRWRVPDLPSNNCKIRVSTLIYHHYDNIYIGPFEVTEESDGTFAINGR